MTDLLLMRNFKKSIDALRRKFIDRLLTLGRIDDVEDFERITLSLLLNISKLALIVFKRIWQYVCLGGYMF